MFERGDIIYYHSMSGIMKAEFGYHMPLDENGKTYDQFGADAVVRTFFRGGPGHTVRVVAKDIIPERDYEMLLVSDHGKWLANRIEEASWDGCDYDQEDIDEHWENKYGEKNWREIMDKGLKNISKAMSHALRHAPEEYGITLDAQGWTNYDDFLNALSRKSPALRDINRLTVDKIMKESDKARYEVRGNRIRACYGHSLPGKIEHTPQEPPEFLYHGTPTINLPNIAREGLKSMSRQYVHASEDVATAEMVARRWRDSYTILRIKAREAWESGVNFYNGNDDIWMMDSIGPEFIEKNK